MTRVLIADPDVLFASALAEVLTDQGYDVAGHVATCAAAVARLEAARLDPVQLVVADSELPGGLAPLTRRPETPPSLLVLSAVRDHDRLITALDASAAGFVGKDARLPELLLSLAAVVRGEAVIPRAMLGGLLHELVQQRRTAVVPTGRAPLSRREQQVLELLAQGQSQEGIARELVISPQTARTHIQKVIGKLGVHSRIEAVALAVEHGLVPAT